jgi:hypothetical protein
MTEMTQREAVARAWSCAEVAHDSLCALGDVGKADAYGRLAQVWTAVAAQLPFEPVPAELDLQLVPMPRPLEREPTNVLSPAELSREQAAAAAALRGEPVDETLVLSVVATPRPESADPYDAEGRATCRCGSAILWRGGGWVHEETGELHCVAR